MGGLGLVRRRKRRNERRLDETKRSACELERKRLYSVSLKRRRRMQGKVGSERRVIKRRESGHSRGSSLKSRGVSVVSQDEGRDRED